MSDTYKNDFFESNQEEIEDYEKIEFIDYDALEEQENETNSSHEVVSDIEQPENHSIENESLLIGETEQVEEQEIKEEQDEQDSLESTFNYPKEAEQIKEEMEQMSMEHLIGFQMIDGEGQHQPTRLTGSIHIDLLPIKDIKITKRNRIDTGEIEGLKESIRKFGLLNPIHVIKMGDFYLLLDGYRRIQALSSLGYETICAVIDETIPPFLVKYYEVMFNQTKPYTFTEKLLYGKFFKETQPSVGYETIENALGLNVGDFLKMLYIDSMKDMFPQIYNQVEQGKLGLSQAYKKIEKEIEKKEKEETSAIDDLNSGVLDDQLRNKNELMEVNVDAGKQDLGNRKILDPVLRRSVESRDGGYCQCCGFGKGEPDFMGVFKVHHIIAVQYGGSDNKRNLILLCNNCHQLVHDYENGRFLPEQSTYDKHNSVKRIVVLGNMLQKMRQQAIKEIRSKHQEVGRVMDAGKITVGQAIKKVGLDLKGEEQFNGSPYDTFKELTSDLDFGGRVKGELGQLNTEEVDEVVNEVEK